MNALSQSLSPQTCHVSEIGRLLSTADTMLEADSDAARLCLERARALLLATSPARAVPVDPAGRSGLAPWQLQRVTQTIEARLSGKIMVEELAQLVRLGSSYFSRAFRRSTGHSPHAYVMIRRIERAKWLMRHSDLPLSQIALECGMADQPHLSRAFRQATGTRPTTWRRVMQREGASVSEEQDAKRRSFVREFGDQARSAA